MHVRDAAEILKQTVGEFSDDGAPRMAAALAYYTIFSLPPLLVLLITLAGLFLDAATVQSWIEGQVAALIGTAGSAQITTMIRNAQVRVQEGFSLGLILSIAGLLFGATGAFGQIQGALNAAWEIESRPSRNSIVAWLTKRILSLAMILVIAFLLLVFFVITSLIATFSDQLSATLPGGISGVLLWIVNAVVSFVVITLLFAAIFVILPDAKIAWKNVWLGAFATALLFVIGKFLIGLYLGHSNPGEAYGAAASLALLLVWVYYSSMILFLGAEFTQVWTRRRGEIVQPDDGAVKIVKKRRQVPH